MNLRLRKGVQARYSRKIRQKNEKRKTMNTKNRVLKEVSEERDRQDTIYGALPKDRAPSVYLGILASEFGEIALAILKGDMQNYREELIQLAAVCVRAVEDLEMGSSAYSLEDVCPHQSQE